MRDYRHKIDIYKQVPKQDDYGENIDSWDIYLKGIWASKDPLLGNEYFNALTANNKVEIKFNMRYIHGVTSDMRIKDGNSFYEIIRDPINVKGLNRELLCYCKLVK